MQIHPEVAWRCHDRSCADIAPRPIGVDQDWDAQECANCGSDHGQFVLLVPLDGDQLADITLTAHISLNLIEVGVE